MSSLDSIIPYTLYGTSIVTDSIATYFNVRKNGPQVEDIAFRRKGVEENGPEYLLKRDLINIILDSAVAIGTAYFIDRIIGMEDSSLNLHKGFCYIVGAFKHLQAIGHIAYLYDNKYTNCIFKLVEKI